MCGLFSANYCDAKMKKRKQQQSGTLKYIFISSYSIALEEALQNRLNIFILSEKTKRKKLKILLISHLLFCADAAEKPAATGGSTERGKTKETCSSKLPI